MKDIIVVYPSKNIAMKLRALIEKGGYHVSHICAHGSTALEIAQEKEKALLFVLLL